MEYTNHCDESCYHAHSRDLSRQYLTEKIQKRKDARIKADMKEWTKLIVRSLQLELLFYQGCIKRQTKQQLQLLIQRLKDHHKATFLYADEHKEEFRDEDYFVASLYCRQGFHDKYETLCDAWSAP